MSRPTFGETYLYDCFVRTLANIFALEDIYQDEKWRAEMLNRQSIAGLRGFVVWKKDIACYNRRVNLFDLLFLVLYCECDHLA